MPPVTTTPAATPALAVDRALLAAGSPVPAIATPIATDSSPALPAATPQAPQATPLGLDQVPGLLATAPGAEAIAVEPMASHLEVTPGQPVQYRFQLTNTVGAPVTVHPLAVNSLPGWIGRILEEDGSPDLDGVLTIGAWQSTIVVVEVVVPANARVGDLNTTSLRLGTTGAPANGDPPVAGGARAGDDSRELADEPA